MAKPRVFISSTFYDLRQIRADIDQFLRAIGYETIRNEVGDIAYGREKPLEDDCIKEVAQCDILISIIGGRFGSESRDKTSINHNLERMSISQRELRTALDNNKQVYIFIDKNVDAEFQTYLLNKETEKINYRFVDDKRIYEFIENIKNLDHNNNIKNFETSEEITKYLREQFAGLFQRFLDSQIRIKEYNLIKELESTSKNLNQIAQFLSDQNKDKKKEIDQILMINHPLIGAIKNILPIYYNFYIEGYDDLNQLLKARGFNEAGDTVSPNGDYYFSWQRTRDKETNTIGISKKLFDDQGKLKSILANNWKGDFVYTQTFTSPVDDDLPF